MKQYDVSNFWEYVVLTFSLVLKSLCGIAEGYDTIGHESEYMERHSVSKLIGSPPGYVGYGDGRALTEAVHQKLATLILINEIEKAHPDAFNILQVFKDGHLNNPHVLTRVISFAL